MGTKSKTKKLVNFLKILLIKFRDIWQTRQKCFTLVMGRFQGDLSAAVKRHKFAKIEKNEAFVYLCSSLTHGSPVARTQEMGKYFQLAVYIALIGISSYII